MYMCTHIFHFTVYIYYLCIHTYNQVLCMFTIYMYTHTLSYQVPDSNDEEAGLNN